MKRKGTKKTQKFDPIDVRRCRFASRAFNHFAFNPESDDYVEHGFMARRGENGDMYFIEMSAGLMLKKNSPQYALGSRWASVVLKQK